MATTTKKKATTKVATNEDNVVDINLGNTEKKRFRLDGDSTRIIELNTSDLRILSRLEEASSQINELVEEASKITDDDEDGTKFSERLAELDKKARDILNYLFDSDIADKCTNGGSMFDIFNGEFRFNIIIERLFDLYEQNIQEESKKLDQKLKKYTEKYNN